MLTSLGLGNGWQTECNSEKPGLETGMDFSGQKRILYYPVLVSLLT